MIQDLHPIDYEGADKHMYELKKWVNRNFDEGKDLYDVKKFNRDVYDFIDAKSTKNTRSQEDFEDDYDSDDDYEDFDDYED